MSTVGGSMEYDDVSQQKDFPYDVDSPLGENILNCCWVQRIILLLCSSLYLCLYRDAC